MIQPPARSTSPASSPALEAIGASKRYGRSGPWALLDVDLSVPTGSVTALIGPNGAGKSTLIRSWVGFERLTRGDVRAAGIDPRRDPAGVVGAVGYVSQSTNLYRGLSVRDHLAMARTFRPRFDVVTARQRLEGLSIPLAQKAGSLSGGQAAQLALCLALGTGAPLLLLDEPLASLDPLARNEFLDVLGRAIRERGATALLSSHIVSDVQAVCDRIVVLGGGRITLDARIEDALAEHRLLSPGDEGRGAVVATFARPGGGSATLTRSTDPALPRPTLEELVVGYLAGGRAAQAPSADTDAVA